MKASTRRLLYILVFLSGFAGLVYQVLWMRQLGLLFGNTSHAAAATLSVFFAGLAVGSWFWGKRTSRIQNAMRIYALLEVGIALSALLYFVILKIFQGIYPGIYQSIQSPALLLTVKGLLACLLVFPPAFFMGGTIPVIGQYMIRQKSLFGSTTAWLYGINTIGAAMGALLSAFILVALIGFNMTCIIAMAVTSTIALVAFKLSSAPQPESAANELEADDDIEEKPSKKKKKKAKGKQPQKAEARWLIYALAFVSGFSVLALEVLWTRIFAQLHENSVYSFASVLIIVLVCLAAGALIASRLAKLKQPPMQTLMLLTVISGSAVALFPFILMKMTDGFTMMEANVTFTKFASGVFIIGITSIGPPCLLLGTVFPFLMKSEEHYADEPGKSIGYLTAVNTVGAILGSLLCGFVMLHVFGMWRTLQLLTAVYLIVGLCLPSGNSGLSLAGKAYGMLFLVLSFWSLSPMNLPLMAKRPPPVGWPGTEAEWNQQNAETILEKWETSDCTVVVIENSMGTRAIKVNSNYSLGSTGAIPHQIFQTRVPLFMFPETKRIFYLGMGTGITAGASLDKNFFPNVEEVVVCELVPEVVEASKKYIASYEGEPDYTNGLFTDSRVEVLAEDGRHYLMATDKTFDMINADLFLPYRSGAGSLYSVEHFRNAKERLSPGGVMVQWLPHYQITKHEFGVISRTMLEVFDHVTLWRNNFQPGGEIMALVGHKGSGVLPPCTIDSRRDKLISVSGMDYTMMQQLQLPLNEQTTLLFYAGNISAARDMFDEYPINTDDKPIIEYSAPKTLREREGDTPSQFLGPPLADLVDELLKRTPPESDPVLANRTPENKRLPAAGAAFHRAWIGRTFNDIPAWRNGWQEFVNGWLNIPENKPEEE